MILGSKQVRITRLGKTFTCSERTRDALDDTTAKFRNRFPKAKLRIVQGTNSLGPLSAGTHSEDDCIDFEVEGVDWWEAQFFFRDECGMWIWFRHTGTWADEDAWHLHGGWLPPGVTYGSSKEAIGRALKAVGWKVGEYVDGGWTTHGRITTSSQIYDYLQKTFGLKNQHQSGADRSRFPKTIRPFDLAAYRRRKEDPVGALTTDIRALAKEHDVTVLYLCRIGLKYVIANSAGARRAAARVAGSALRPFK